MSRRWKIALVVVAGLLVLVIGGILALRLSSPPVFEFNVSNERKDLPEAWLAPDGEPPVEAPPPAVDPAPSTEQPDSPSTPESLSTSGTLAFVSDGRSFGEESYELQVDEDRLSLTSLGRFRFKALVATINITFEQRLEGDGALRPRSYDVSFDAPLGFDRAVHVELADGRAVATSGDSRTITSVDEPFIVGTFATYTLLPIVFSERQVDGTAVFEVLAFGGPPSQTGEGNGGPSRMVVERRPPVIVRVADSTLSVDAFFVRSSFGDGTVLAKGREFLAFLAAGEDGTLAVYRTDYFPAGFEIVGDLDLPAAVP